MKARPTAKKAATARRPVGPRRRLADVTLAALGVVYGDIGTSPLYALKEVFGGAHHPVPVNEDNVLGILSLVFWSLMLVVSIKYVIFIMRADNKRRRRHHGADGAGAARRAERRPRRAC